MADFDNSNGSAQGGGGFDAWSPWVAQPGLPPAPGQATFEPAQIMIPGQPPPSPAPQSSAPFSNDYARPLVDISTSSAVAPAHLLPPPPPSVSAAPQPTNGLGDNAAVVPENGHTLGLALLLVGVGSAVGVKYGGLFGGTAGAVYGGAAVNAIRSARAVIQGTPEADREALVSGTYAVIGAGFATWLVWKTNQRRTAK